MLSEGSGVISVPVRGGSHFGYWHARRAIAPPGACRGSVPAGSRRARPGPAPAPSPPERPPLPAAPSEGPGLRELREGSQGSSPQAAAATLLLAAHLGGSSGSPFCRGGPRPGSRTAAGPQSAALAEICLLHQVVLML